MPRKRTELKKALGKLITAIQKEWREQAGEEYAEFSEEVMNSAHILLQAGSVEKVSKVLGPLTLRQYLGEVWLQAHPKVKPAMLVVESLLEKGQCREQNEKTTAKEIAQLSENARAALLSGAIDNARKELNEMDRLSDAVFEAEERFLVKRQIAQLKKQIETGIVSILRRRYPDIHDG